MEAIVRGRPAGRTAPAGAARRRIIDAVRTQGAAALFELTRRFDGGDLESLGVSEAEFAAADDALGRAEHAAIETAIANVHRFHAAQGAPPLRIETAPGVLCERLSVPLTAVGLYVPAGSAPLPSTAIMLAVPAAIARCPVRVLCTPARANGAADSAVLVAARRAGVGRIF